MYRFLIAILILSSSFGCASSKKGSSSNRSLMIADQRDLPRNAKMKSPRYQQKVRKSQKQTRKNNKKAYKRQNK